MKTDAVRIGAKELADLNMPDFCPRCFWLKRKAKALPYQIFPGIFSSIDSYTKKIVHGHFDTYGAPPKAMAEALEGAVKYLPPPSWQKFQRRDDVTGIIVSGSLDGLFVRADGSHIIPDYKTAKYTEGQDKLSSLYEAQLNAYRWIDEGFGNVVHSTPLIYCEPMTPPNGNMTTEAGFNLGFSVKTVQIQHKPGLIKLLLTMAKEILDMPYPPYPDNACSDCERLGLIFSLLCTPKNESQAA